jgi:hypothetical protein
MMLPIIAFFLYIYLGLKKPGIALVTSPFVCAVIFLLGAEEESEILLFSSPIILFATLVAILYSKFDPEKEEWPRKMAKYFLSVLLLILAGVCLAILLGPFSTFVIFFLIIVSGSVIIYGLTSRYATASFVLSTIGASIRQNLPLPMALESASTGYTDGRIRILQRIKYWLVQGYSLSDAIRRGYPGCPGHALAMIAVA